MLSQRVTQRGVIGGGGGGLGDDHHIEWRAVGLVVSEGLTDLAFDAVTRHRLTGYFAGDVHPQPRVRLGVGRCTHQEQRVFAAAAVLEHRRERGTGRHAAETTRGGAQELRAEPGAALGAAGT